MIVGQAGIAVENVTLCTAACVAADRSCHFAAAAAGIAVPSSILLICHSRVWCSQRQESPSQLRWGVGHMPAKMSCPEWRGVTPRD